MLVLFNGLSHFGNILVNELNKFDTKNKYLFLDTYTSKKAKLLFILLLPFSKLVVSFNGVSDRSGSMDWVLRFKKKLLMQWQGTDVLLATERMKRGTIFRKYLDYAIHTTDFIYLQKELEPILEHISLLPYKYCSSNKVEVSNYQQLTVLTYVAKNREQFYGIDKIELLAKEFPSVTFFVVGTDNKKVSMLSNIQILGWVDQQLLTQLMREHPIFIRLTEHDGNSVTVLEALKNGQEVIWTYPSPYVYHASNENELLLHFHNILKIVEERGMVSNQINSNYVISNFQRDKILSNYVHFLNNLVNS